MNFQRGQRADEPEINLIPLIDVLLVILIFLMVTTTYARFAELQINLPQAQGDTAEEAPAQINVVVEADGGYLVDDVAVSGASVEALGKALASAADAREEPVLVISADALATHQAVVRVMDAARRVNLPRVTFVTQTPSQDAP